MGKRIYHGRNVITFIFVISILIFSSCSQSPESSNIPLSPATTTNPMNKIVYESYFNGEPCIFVMNKDGSGQVRLTGGDYWDTSPKWSPDGSKIAFESDRDGIQQIYVMNVDGSNQVKITDYAAPNEAGGPDWSPDSQKIAYHVISGTGGDVSANIYVMDADGSNKKRVTNGKYMNTSPSWSPDGTKIAFDSDRDSTKDERIRHIYVMDANGSNQHRLTTSQMYEVYPDWSPDGTKITFHSPANNIIIVNSDGSNLIKLNVNNGDGLLPSWSPDGSKIAFVYSVSFKGQIWVMDVDGSNQVALTNGDHDSSPFWSP